jgi:hypothetical protein
VTCDSPGKSFALVAQRTPPDRYAGYDPWSSVASHPLAWTNFLSYHVGRTYGQIIVESPPTAFVVYGRDKDTTKKLEEEQHLWIVIGVTLQVSGPG